MNDAGRTQGPRLMFYFRFLEPQVAPEEVPEEGDRESRGLSNAAKQCEKNCRLAAGANDLRWFFLAAGSTPQRLFVRTEETVLLYQYSLYMSMNLDIAASAPAPKTTSRSWVWGGGA